MKCRQPRGNRHATQHNVGEARMYGATTEPEHRMGGVVDMLVCPRAGNGACTGGHAPERHECVGGYKVPDLWTYCLETCGFGSCGCVFGALRAFFHSKGEPKSISTNNPPLSESDRGGFKLNLVGVRWASGRGGVWSKRGDSAGKS